MCDGLLGILQLFEGLCIHAKKKEQKNIFKRIKKLLTIFKLKRGRSIYFRACSTEEEPADDLLIKPFFFFFERDEKKKKKKTTTGLMCLTL